MGRQQLAVVAALEHRAAQAVRAREAALLLGDANDELGRVLADELRLVGGVGAAVRARQQQLARP